MSARQSALDLVDFGYWQSLPVVGAGKAHLVGHDDISDHLRSEDVLSLPVQQVVVNGLVGVFLEGYEEPIVALLEEIWAIIQLQLQVQSGFHFRPLHFQLLPFPLQELSIFFDPAFRCGRVETIVLRSEEDSVSFIGDLRHSFVAENLAEDDLIGHDKDEEGN